MFIAALFRLRGRFFCNLPFLGPTLDFIGSAVALLGGTLASKKWNYFAVIFFSFLLTPILVSGESILSLSAYGSTDISLSEFNNKNCVELLTGNGQLTKGNSVVIKDMHVNGDVAEGRSYRLSRVGSSWNSGVTDYPNAPQGDPRTIIRILGAEVAQFLGFEIIDSETMVAPDAIRLNLRIKMLNRYLPSHAQIEMRFFNTDPEDPRVNARQFVKLYGNAGETPMATHGVLLVHDISYHTAIIVFPRTAFLQSQIIANLITKFAEFAEPKLTSEFGKRGGLITDFFFNHFSQHLDATTGNFTGSLINDIERPSSLVAREIWSLVGINVSALDRLTVLVRSSLTDTSIRSQFQRHKLLGDNEQQALIRMRVENLLQAFLALKETQDPSFIKKYSIATEEIGEEIQMIRSQLVEAVRRSRLQ